MKTALFVVPLLACFSPILQAQPQVPNKPSLSGPASGYVMTCYDYTTVASDPDGDAIRYTFNWGDGTTTVSAWLPSGTPFIASHKWTTAARTDSNTGVTTQRVYPVKVSVTDGVGSVESDPINATFDLQWEPQPVATILESGPRDHKINIVFIGDGMTAAQMTNYAAAVQQFYGYLFSGTKWTFPYTQRRDAFNVYRINVISPDPGSELDRNYVFGAGANSGGTGGGVIYNFDNVDWALEQVPGADIVVALVNGGGSGAWGEDIPGVGDEWGAKVRIAMSGTSFNGGLQWNGEWTAYHELGHALWGGVDEYADYNGTAIYTGPEPVAFNVTIDRTPSNPKWGRYLGIDPLWGMEVGFIEGAWINSFGIYRSELYCTMRTQQDTRFCIACRKAIHQKINAKAGIVNIDPSIPSLAGPAAVAPGASATYTAIASDPDGGDLTYTFYWGEPNTIDGYIYPLTTVGPVASGTPVTASHAWSANGVYPVKVLAEDARGGFSGWSSTISVTVAVQPLVLNPFVTILGNAGWLDVDASACASGISAMTCRWDFGDGTTGQGLTAEHRYAGAGPWTIRLDVTDGTGAAGSIEIIQIAWMGARSGDINRDGIINLSDIFALLPPTYGSTAAVDVPVPPAGPATVGVGTSAGFSAGVTEAYNASADLEPDGVLNLSDVFYLLPPRFGMRFRTRDAYLPVLTDLRMLKVRYTYGWGDGSTTTSAWEANGTLVSMSHSWAAPGTYSIRVRAEREDGQVSAWSALQNVTVP